MGRLSVMVIGCILLLPFLINAQQDAFTKNTDIVYQVVDHFPEFPGGVIALKKYITDHVIFSLPKTDNRGLVAYTSFVIDTTGAVTQIKLIRSSGNEDFDKDALKVVATLPNFIPGTQSGRKVFVYYNLAVRPRKLK